MNSVREWQAGPGRIDYLGAPLKVDGDMGAKTRWAMHLETLAPWRQSAIRAFLSLRGMREQASNRGTLHDAALALCGVPQGSPYCAAFYSWALWVAGAVGLLGFRPNASVVALRASLRPVLPELAQPGDFASLAHPDGTHGHGGMVIWPGAEWMCSVDANIGDEVDVIRYPVAARQYFSPEAGFAARIGEPPDTIRLYGGGRDR